MPYMFEADPDFRFIPGRFNTGEDYAVMTRDFEGFDEMKKIPCGRTRLLAWNAAEARPAWEIHHAGGIPGGVLTTAGGLIFQGADRALHAYDATTGERLWSGPVGIDVMAPPVTYTVDGEQYVAVLAGAGGAGGLHFESLDYINDGRLLAWKLGGTAAMPAVQPRPKGQAQVARIEVDAATLDRGRARYAQECMRCHGGSAISSGLLPDLRWSSALVHESWDEIVLGGTRASRGMASFADLITPEDSQAIHAYVVDRAHHEPGLGENLAAFAARNLCIPVSWVTD
jgi:mono/diheme cytochrome c family protein